MAPRTPLLLLALLAATAQALQCSQYNRDRGCRRCDESGEECREWCPGMAEGAVSASKSGRCYDCYKLTRDPWCNVCYVPYGVNPGTGHVECKECWQWQPDAEDPFLITKGRRGRCVACERCKHSQGWASCDGSGRCLTCRTEDRFQLLPVGGRCVHTT